MTIDVKVPDGESGAWKVQTFTVSEQAAEFENLRAAIGASARPIQPGTYKRLTRNGQVIMSNTPAEIGDALRFIRWAHGNILVNGLGLGVVLTALLDKPEVTRITVIENSQDVINLVGPTFENDPRVQIICADAYTYQPPKGEVYDYVWHDIWDDICSDNLEGMKKLHRKYGRKAKAQLSWCRDMCEYYKRRDSRRYW